VADQVAAFLDLPVLGQTRSSVEIEHKYTPSSRAVSAADLLDEPVVATTARGVVVQ
jgi:hypothetical protein